MPRLKETGFCRNCSSFLPDGGYLCEWCIYRGIRLSDFTVPRPVVSHSSDDAKKIYWQGYFHGAGGSPPLYPHT